MIARMAGVAALALTISACATGSAADRAYLRQYARAEAAGRPFAPVTDARPKLTMPAAYRLQARIVARRIRGGDRVAGYKGGLMSAASLRQRGVTEPLIGVLFASGRAGNNASLSLCAYRRASFEVKLGFVFSQAPGPGADVAALKRAVSAVLPVIDLPDIGYRDPDHYGAVDMVAANVSAARWVAGDAQAAGANDLDGLRTTIARDGQALASGFGRESLGGQWDSLRQLVDRIAASGRTLRPGDIVITGKMGDRGWLLPGVYDADYGPLGRVGFTVTPCPA